MTRPIQSEDLEHSPNTWTSIDAPSQDSAADVQAARRRYERIAEAAYRRAEQRGFAPGGELDDWLAAEREFDAAEKGATR